MQSMHVLLILEVQILIVYQLSTKQVKVSYSLEDLLSFTNSSLNASSPDREIPTQCGVVDKDEIGILQRLYRNDRNKGRCQIEGESCSRCQHRASLVGHVGIFSSNLRSAYLVN
jgi:hypothetical protein